MSTSFCRCSRLFVTVDHLQPPNHVHRSGMFAKWGDGSHANVRYASGYRKKSQEGDDRTLPDRIEYRDKASLNGLQKRFLVWTGRYDTMDDIPDMIRVDALGQSINTMFLLGYSWYLLFFVIALYVVVVMWKREWKKGVEAELRNTVVRRTNEPQQDYERRFQRVLKKDIHFLRYGYKKYGPDIASWQNEESEIDAKKFSAQRERMREKHLDLERKRAMQQYASDTEHDWEKRLEQLTKTRKK